MFLSSVDIVDGDPIFFTTLLWVSRPATISERSSLSTMCPRFALVGVHALSVRPRDSIAKAAIKAGRNVFCFINMAVSIDV